MEPAEVLEITQRLWEAEGKIEAYSDLSRWQGKEILLLRVELKKLKNGNGRPQPKSPMPRLVEKLKKRNRQIEKELRRMKEANKKKDAESEKLIDVGVRLSEQIVELNHKRADLEAQLVAGEGVA